MTGIKGPDVFAKPLEIDSAHRSTGPIPGQGVSARPRGFTLCFCWFQENERTLRWARQRDLKYRNTILRVYPDMTAALAKKDGLFQRYHANALQERNMVPSAAPGTSSTYKRRVINRLFHSPEEVSITDRLPKQQEAG